MKKNLIYAAMVAIPFVFACNQSSQSEKDSSKKPDSLISDSCYTAIFENDTAKMALKTFTSGKIKGSIFFAYAAKQHDNGTFEGKYSGDTLLVDYRFKTGKDTTTVYANPLAFLKKDKKLIMGIGKIETTMGRSYFVKDTPIDYEAGKFTFASVPCK